MAKSLTDGNIIDAVIVCDPMSVALLIDAGDDLYTRINIPLDSIEECWKLAERCVETNPIESYLKKFHLVWLEKQREINDKIKMAKGLEDKELLKGDFTKYVFKWTLVRQECEMYCLIGEEVDPKDFKLVCKRRGFDDDMKKFLLYVMKHVGLGDKI